MLQIIGWILCLYLVVKGFELFSAKREEGSGPRTLALTGGVIAWLGAVVFFVMVNEQADSSNRMPSDLGSLSTPVD
jgi:hypothetical protein